MSEVHETSPTPFIVALVGFVIVAVLAFLFLREDDDLETRLPDRVRAVDGDTVTAEVATSGCDEIVRAQVDVSDEDRVFVEVVTRRGSCGDSGGDHTVTIDLPQPIGDRDVVAGVGRVELPCTPDGRCGPGR